MHIPPVLTRREKIQNEKHTFLCLKYCGGERSKKTTSAGQRPKPTELPANENAEKIQNEKLSFPVLKILRKLSGTQTTSAGHRPKPLFGGRSAGSSILRTLRKIYFFIQEIENV